MSRKLYVHQRSDGCIESFLDFAKTRSTLLLSGWELTSDISEADLVLVNTCIVGTAVQQHCQEDIENLKKQMKPGAKLIVTGCMPAYDPDTLKQLGVDFAFSPRQFHKFVNAFKLDKIAPDTDQLEKEYLGPYNLFNWTSKLIQIANKFKIPFPYYFYKRFSLIEDSDTRYIRISRGCLEACSFCATKFATGKLVSFPPEVILSRFDNALKQGARKFALCAEDTGCYGRDIGTSLHELLAQILKRNADFVLTIRQHHPRWLIQDLDNYLPLLADPRIKSITIPVQSGSDRILKLMKRKHTSAQFRNAMDKITKVAPHIMLRTHVIVGFPTETDEDFSKTVDIIKSYPWDMVLVFPYTDRPKTAASKITPKVDWHTIQVRAIKLNLVVLWHVYLNKGAFLPLSAENPMEAPRMFE